MILTCFDFAKSILFVRLAIQQWSRSFGSLRFDLALSRRVKIIETYRARYRRHLNKGKKTI